MRRLIFAGALVLAGCNSQSDLTTRYDAQVTLLAADNVALTYLAQPPCTTAATPTCRDPATATRIKQASAAVTAARHAVNDAIAAGRTPDNASLTAAIIAFGAVVAPFQSLVK